MPGNNLFRAKDGKNLDVGVRQTRMFLFNCVKTLQFKYPLHAERREKVEPAIISERRKRIGFFKSKNNAFCLKSCVVVLKQVLCCHFHITNTLKKWQVFLFLHNACFYGDKKSSFLTFDFLIVEVENSRHEWKTNLSGNVSGRKPSARKRRAWS